MSKKLDKRLKARLTKQIAVLRSQLNEIEDREDCEKNSALIGKCFVYDNGYSLDLRWPLYSRVTGINENGWLKVIRVQIDCDGKVEIENTTLCGESCLEKEITLNEFCKALNDAHAKTLEIMGEAFKA